MAIEPISSVMTIQTQGSVTTKMQTASQQTEKMETNAGDSASTQEAAKVDSSLNVIEESQEKGYSNNDQKEQSASAEQIRKAVEQINKNINNNNSEAIFGIHEGTNRVTIKLIDKETKKVIKELPPEKTLDMIARVWDMAGILVDEKR